MNQSIVTIVHYANINKKVLIYFIFLPFSLYKYVLHELFLIICLSTFHISFFLIPKQFCIRLRHPTSLRIIVIHFKSLLCWEFSLHVLQGELCCFVVQLASLQRVPGEQHKVELNGSLIGPIDLKSKQPIMNIKV